MSLDKSYPNRKDQRKPYYKSGKHDRSCRPGGRCPYCKQNRGFNSTLQETVADEALKEFDNGEGQNT